MAAARVLGLTVSLCHGPGCRREQTVPFWCSARCREAWDAQHAGVDLARRGAGGVFDAARDRILAAMEDGCPLCPPGDVPITVAIEGNVVRDSAPSMVEAIQRAADLVREMAPPSREPVKLTREQFEELRAASPTYPDYAQRSTFGDVPVVLVDSLEDSTPYLHELARFSHAVEANRLLVSSGAEFPQVASEGPQVARGWLGRWFGRMFGKDHG
jgi:hypothetical protein